MVPERDQKLLDKIANYRTLSEKEQKKVRPILIETIERHIGLQRTHEVLDEYVTFLEEQKQEYQ